MTTYTGMRGTLYTTLQRLGKGGEGTVYTIDTYDHLVAKIYRSNKFRNTNERSTMERKLRAMIAMKVEYKIDNVVRFAWPQDILYENNTMVGFIMPRLETRYKIFDIYREGNPRKIIYPNYTWKYSIQFAYHLAWLVDYLHSKGIIIGDFNQTNIAIDSNYNTVIIIDCDSFDINDPVSGEHFPCPVGLSEMLAPELQIVGDLSKGTFTKESDYFSLAIHIFRLLMNNADPFGGIIVSRESQSNIPANQSICNGECAYVRHVPNKKIPDWSPKLTILPEEIRKLFNKTFNYTALTAKKNIKNRATAYEWCIALAPYGEKEPNPRLKTCSKNKTHVYAANNRECPWCRLESGSNTQGPKDIKTPLYALFVCLLFICLIGVAISNKGSSSEPVNVMPDFDINSNNNEPTPSNNDEQQDESTNESGNGDSVNSPIDDGEYLIVEPGTVYTVRYGGYIYSIMEENNDYIQYYTSPGETLEIDERLENHWYKVTYYLTGEGIAHQGYIIIE